ncbi:hypothetical protein CDD83_9969 [Cordyceps sp. RAO-2017]|nr:hypothetical protein CDD83_9969 [Cordyceps sp. RAO-2017]
MKTLAVVAAALAGLALAAPQQPQAPANYKKEAEQACMRRPDGEAQPSTCGNKAEECFEFKNAPFEENFLGERIITEEKDTLTATCWDLGISVTKTNFTDAAWTACHSQRLGPAECGIAVKTCADTPMNECIKKMNDQDEAKLVERCLEELPYNSRCRGYAAACMKRGQRYKCDEIDQLNSDWAWQRYRDHPDPKVQALVDKCLRFQSHKRFCISLADGCVQNGQAETCKEIDALNPEAAKAEKAAPKTKDENASTEPKVAQPQEEDEPWLWYI